MYKITLLTFCDLIERSYKYKVHVQVGQKSEGKSLVLYLHRVLYLRAVALQITYCTVLFELRGFHRQNLKIRII